MNTLGLFAGGGGLDLGFAAAGFNIVLSSDIDAHSCKTLENNQGKYDFYANHAVFCDDIANLNLEKITELCGAKSKIDFMIGGPPCQAFSISGKRKGLEDPRGNLVFQYARLIKEIEPTGFLLENVAGLKTIHGGTLYQELLEVLSFDGKYTVSAQEYEVADFGIPQFRKRLFFVGNKIGKVIPAMETTHTAPNTLYNGHLAYKTVGKALENMPIAITDWKLTPSIDSHVGREHSQRIIDRYASLRFGERDPKTRINKLNPDKPSYTIIVGSDKGGGKGHVHPFIAREVTPRESARLQTFPDWWEFYGAGRHVIRQVGNAVPPLFAAQFAAHIAFHIFGIKNVDTYDSLIKKLNLNFLQ
jgi:DNA (cytosine-5)-methyltransferase 1